MNKNPLYLVPTDRSTPYPICFTRITNSLRSLSQHPEITKDESTLKLTTDNISLIVSIDRSGRHFSVRSQMNIDEPYEAIEDLLFLITDEWNRERLFPTAYVLPTSSGTTQIVADLLVNCQYGLSDDQLENYLQVALTTTKESIEYLTEAVSTSIGPLSTTDQLTLPTTTDSANPQNDTTRP